MSKSKTKPHSIKLPSKPSALILIALKDLQKAVKEGCRIDMVYWHSPSIEYEQVSLDEFGRKQKYIEVTYCTVCLAGAVMRRGVDDNEEAKPFIFNETVCNKLYALDDFREGNIRDAIEGLGLDWEPFRKKRFPSVVKITSYASNPKFFFRDMTKLATRLAKAGY